MTLIVDDLHVRFRTNSETVRAVNGASFAVGDGEVVGLVGESGSGKSVTARSIVRLEDPGEIVRGSITVDGTEMTTASDQQLRRLRARELSIVFQHPSEALNPVSTVGEQIAEAFRVRQRPDDQPFFRELVAGIGTKIGAAGVRSRVLELLEDVGIPQPADRIDTHPHQLSEGMCERVMLAIALAGRPSILIADEPTTALDTTTQAAILDRLDTLTESFGMGMLLISHDIGLVSRISDRIVVMNEGTIVESGPTEAVLANPSHPHTEALLACRPGQSEPGDALPMISGGSSPTANSQCDETAVVDGGSTDAMPCDSRAFADESTVAPVELDGVTKSFRTDDTLLGRVFGESDRLTAVSDVSLTLRTDETVGLVGESGCGKSTLARLITGLETPETGTVRLHGEPVGAATSRRSEQLESIGVVFQNPATSFNPRRTVRASIAEPLQEAGWSASRRRERVDELLSLVDLRQEHAGRYPTQLSGGQRQRVAIARAIALEPSVLVLDEPTTALDVSVQARLLNLLADLQAELELTYLFVTHDLEVVRHVADRVAVMYLGELVETGPAQQVLSEPAHPYTGTLLSAAPNTDLPQVGEPGSEPPDPTNRPTGCAFADRCPVAEASCTEVEPPVETVAESRSKCHRTDAWSAYWSRMQADTEPNDD